MLTQHHRGQPLNRPLLVSSVLLHQHWSLLLPPWLIPRFVPADRSRHRARRWGSFFASSQSTPFVPFFLCTVNVCPTPLRIRILESVWASSAPAYLTSNPWRNYQILPARVIQAITSVCQTAPGSTPPRRRQAISSSSSPAVTLTAKSPPPPTYEVALADSTARAVARQKELKAASSCRTLRLASLSSLRIKFVLTCLLYERLQLPSHALCAATSPSWLSQLLLASTPSVVVRSSWLA